jgi:hypothetical protein
MPANMKAGAQPEGASNLEYSGQRLYTAAIRTTAIATAPNIASNVFSRPSQFIVILVLAFLILARPTIDLARQCALAVCDVLRCGFPLGLGHNRGKRIAGCCPRRAKGPPLRSRRVDCNGGSDPSYAGSQPARQSATQARSCPLTVTKGWSSSFQRGRGQSVD